MRARLYSTALGVYEAYLNGEQIGDHVLAPGWTSYDHRLRYQTFDVTHLLHPGPNVLGAILGDGWFRGRLGFDGGQRNLYGDRSALLAQLEVTFADGSTACVLTDASGAQQPGQSWKAISTMVSATMHVLSAQAGSVPRYDDRDWSGTRILSSTSGRWSRRTGRLCGQLRHWRRSRSAPRPLSLRSRLRSEPGGPRPAHRLR